MSGLTGAIVMNIDERGQSEDDLRNSEERCRVFIELITEAIWRIEIEPPCPVDISEDEQIECLYRGGYIAECNEIMARMYGFESTGELVGTRVSDMMPRGEPENIAQLRAFIDSGYKLINSESFNLDKEGNTRIFSNNLTGIVENGHLHRVWGTQRDITERRRAQEAVRKSEERFRLLFEQMLDGFYMSTPDGKFVDINPALVKMFGYSSKEEMLRVDIPKELYFSVEERKSYVRDSGSEESDVYRMRRKDGTTIWVEEKGRYIRDSEGKVLFHEGILRDVTERKLAEEKLIESEKRYRFVAESMPEQVWTADAGGLVDYVNRRNIDYFHFPTESLPDAEWFNLIHPDDMEKTAEKWNHSLETGDDYEIEFRLKRWDGAYRWHLCRANAMRNQQGEIIKWFGTNTDIEDLKKAEERLHESETKLQQSQKLESVGRLAGGIAHDFNNMLTAINGYSDLTLRRLAGDDPLRANILEIRKAGERSAQLTQQLLAFSRRQVLKPEVIDLNEVIVDTSNMLQRLIGEDIQLITVLDPKLGRVKADPGQISQVIMNLAVNARDAMPDGGNLTIKTVDVEIDHDFEKRHIPAAPESYVMLEVSDTGTGMNPAIQKQIFEPFFTTKEVGKGTGLGLATVYGIVKQSGGHIQVRSEVEKGAVFGIYLPRIENKPEIDETRNSPGQSRPAGEKILLVEDEDMVRSLTVRILTESGYVVTAARNGVEALRICAEEDCGFDLLVTDVVMPQMGGRELAVRLSETLPGLKVLFTSGYTDDEVFREGITEIGTNFIQKPFAPDELVKKVGDILGVDKL